MDPSPIDDTALAPFAEPPPFVLFGILKPILDDEAALAQLGTCACVSVAWREAAYDPRLWTNLTKWQRTNKEVRRCASFCDERLSSQLALSQVNATVLRRLIERSHGGLLHLDTSPLPIKSEDVEGALSGQGLEGMLLSLRVDGKTIKANTASRDAFVDRDGYLFQLQVAGSLFGVEGGIMGLRSSSPTARGLAVGDVAKGVKPDTRFEAYLDDPSSDYDDEDAMAIHLERHHDRLASFLRI